MANNTVYLYDHKTGVETIREMTDEEQKIRNAEVADYQAARAAKAEAKAQAATDKAALLDKLGITADEAKLLLS